ncbi:hypothetical protein LPJ66_003480 [Kickxella alabastrina]|uniref:Uncharacterized protein n=1 Tax=Kickxella alabastrina TaxID=61397 RepID=A0ACC1IP20_9FUNG|nr:hypothetical protein LPJ66_003480 [Kickxella alabastrina]
MAPKKRRHAHQHAKPYRGSPTATRRSLNLSVKNTAPPSPSPPPALPPAPKPSSNPPTATLHWCQTPGQTTKVQFLGPLSPTAHQGILQTASTASSRSILVQGICPFHIVARHSPDGSTDRRGCSSHMHEASAHTIGTEMTADPRQLALVTAPLPMDVLLRCPELRPISLYYYTDRVFKCTYAQKYRSLVGGSGEPVGAADVPPAQYHPSPWCRRHLQMRAMEPQWMRDPAQLFSLDTWSSIMGADLLFYKRGLSVPVPADRRFSAPDASPVAFAFATQFQRRIMRRQALRHMGGAPWYLDATFAFKQDGFQLWSLFCEVKGRTVPLSFLVTTAVTVRLLVDWLLELTAVLGNVLPSHTLFVNSLRLCEGLRDVFDSWDIRYAKYYVVQDLRYCLRQHPEKKDEYEYEYEYEEGEVGGDVFSERIRRAVSGLRSDFRENILVVRQALPLTSYIRYIWDQRSLWEPRGEREWRSFDYSLDAVGRWRYLLWMSLLPRPRVSRVDSVVYFLNEMIDGIRDSMQDTGGGQDEKGEIGDTQGGVEMEGEGEEMVPFCLDSLEMGSHRLGGNLRASIVKKLGNQLFCFVSTDRELVDKTIVDLDMRVCFCEKFAHSQVCDHLIYCSQDQIHHPILPKLMSEIPKA